MGITLQAASNPGRWANGLLVELRPSYGAKQLAGAALGTPDLDLLLTAPRPGDQTVVTEVVSGLTADAQGALSAAINNRSFYVTAVAPAEPITPDSKLFEGRSVTVGGLTLTTPAVWSPAAALTATITASAAGTGLVDLTLTSAPRMELEVLSSLPSDTAAAGLAKLITERSDYLSATPDGTEPGPLLPQIQDLTSGADASWSVDSFVAAVLAQISEPGSRAASAPAPALDQIAPQVFNVMCIPDLVFASTTDQVSVIAAAHQFCKARQAFLIVDPPPPAAAMTTAWLPGAAAVAVDNIGTAAGMKGLQDWAAQFASPNNDAASVYYPWVQIADQWNNFAPRYVPPSGSVAGVYAATDTSRGVWKAPAGTTAALAGVVSLADRTINDTIIGILNVQGIDCLRTFAPYGNIVWGARTLAGNDLYGSAFKYVSSRRLADFIEQSLQQSLKWSVFEPDGAQVWSAVRIETTAFMAGLYADGAFAGSTAASAFQVVCDATTTSSTDMLAGIVNLDVAFQPAEPAELIELKITLNASSPAAS